MTIINKREEILQNSKKIIQMEGLKALTISKIASKSKISKRTFYVHFSSKEDLFSALGETESNYSSNSICIKSEIVLKALELFSKKGYISTDMECIAAAVGIKRTSIYGYFSSKEELLEYCIFYELEKRKEYNTTIRKNYSNPIEVIKKFIEYNCIYTNSPSSVLVILSKAFSIRNKRIEAMFNDFNSFRMNVLVQVIEDGKRLGMFSENINSEKAAMMFISFFSGINFEPIVNIESIRNEIFDMIYNYIKKEKE